MNTWLWHKRLAKACDGQHRWFVLQLLDKLNYARRSEPENSSQMGLVYDGHRYSG